MNRRSLLNFATCVFVALLATGMSHAGPPELLRLTLPSPIADISAGGVSVPVEFEFRSDHPLHTCYLFVTSPDGDGFGQNQAIFPFQRFPTGGSTSGTFRIDLYVPPFRKAGFWRVAVQLTDSLSSKVTYGDGIPGEAAPGLPLPAGSSTAIEIVNNGGVDTELPGLLQAVISPETVDVTGTEGLIQVTATARDVSGVSSISVSLLDGFGSYAASASMQAAQRISGDEFEGVYQTTLTIPRLLAPGRYRLGWTLFDLSGRSRSYQEQSLPDPFPNIRTGIQVQNTGLSDTAGPELLEISTDRTAFDVTEMEGRLQVRMKMRDAPGGLKDATVSLRRVSDGKSITNWPAYSNVTGDYSTGEVSMSPEIPIPRFLTPGSYQLVVTARDAAPGQPRNSRYDGTAQDPFPGGFTGAIQITNQGPVAGTKPELLSFGVSPRAQTNFYRNIMLEFTAGVSDLHGVSFVSVHLESPNSNGGRLSFPMTLVAGTPQQGRWRAQPYIYTELATGVHRISLRMGNATNDIRIYTNGAFNVLHPFDRIFSIFDAGNAVPFPAPWPDTFTAVGGYPQEPVDAYQIWVMAHGGLTGGHAARHADPDGDGFPNAVEFFCGTDPLIPSHSGGPDPAAHRSPRLGMDNSRRWLEYMQEPKNTHLGYGTNITLRGWKSQGLSLNSWTQVSPQPTSSQSYDFRVYFDAPTAARPGQFLRLSAEP